MPLYQSFEHEETKHVVIKKMKPIDIFMSTQNIEIRLLPKKGQKRKNESAQCYVQLSKSKYIHAYRFCINLAPFLCLFSLIF